MPPAYNFGLFLASSRDMLNNIYIEIFLAAVIIDLLTGLVKSFSPNASHKADSSVGIFGAVKHLLIVVIILLIFPFLDALGFTSFGNAIVIFYIMTYALSIIENLGILGIPLPSWVKDKMEKLSRESDEGHITTFAQAKNVVKDASETVKKDEVK